MCMKEEIKKWIKKAKDDLKKANDNFNIKNFDLASFLCQQAVEKGMKALILQKESKIIKTHDLLFLAERIHLPEDLRGTCKELTLMYVYTRYPDTAEVKDIKNKAQKYLTFTEVILKWIKKQLSKKN